jgi:hypothetical protein
MGMINRIWWLAYQLTLKKYNTKVARHYTRYIPQEFEILSILMIISKIYPLYSINKHVFIYTV